MREHKHFFTKCFAAVLVLLLTGMISAAVASAEEPYIPSQKVIYMDGVVSSSNIQLFGVSGTSAVTKLKSSNKSVAKVSKFTYDDDVYVSIKPIKPGTAKVTFNVKHEGKTIKAKVNVIVRKYVNPLKSFKIGSTNYTSKFKKTGHISVKKALKGKLKIKLKAGYVISEINVYSWSGGGNMKSVKNNKTVKVPKGSTLSLQVRRKNALDEEPMFLEIMVDQ